MSTIRGDIANLYPVRQGQLKTAPFKAAPFKAALLKIARDPADNDLMRREAAALTRLQDVVDPALLRLLPAARGDRAA